MSARELLISNGRVLTEDGWIDGDVLVADGRITDIRLGVSAPAATVVDATGALVVPGLVDLHTHVNWGAGRLGVNPDKNAAISGVTTWVDAGSAGAGGLEGLLEHIAKRSAVRILPFLNLSYIGLSQAGLMTREVGELWDPSFADLRAVLRAAEEHPDSIRGLKVRASSNAMGDNAHTVMPQAREAADLLEVPLMIHVGMAPPTIDELLPYLRAGDIITHCFHPHAGGSILGARGAIKPGVREAVARGVLLDVGHGVASISHDVAARALDQGFLPDTISSDLHAENIGTVLPSLLTVMDMFLALGLSADQVLERVTSRPAAVLCDEEIGRLHVGGIADVAILELAATDRVKQDSTGHRLALRQEFRHRVTVAAGRVLEPFEDGRVEGRPSPWATRFGANVDDETTPTRGDRA